MWSGPVEGIAAAMHAFVEATGEGSLLEIVTAHTADALDCSYLPPGASTSCWWTS